MKTPNKLSRPVRYLIIDSNIFKLLGNPEILPQITFLLGDALTKGYGLAISKFTLLELLDTATVENEVKAFTSIRGLKHFQMNETVLIAAGHLGCLYQDDGVNVKSPPEKGDKIIAGTALINNAVIFTTNGRHFPIPFFTVMSKPILKDKKSDGREVHTVSYFLEPDLDVIGTKYQERINEHQRKIDNEQKKLTFNIAPKEKESLE